MHRKIVNSLKFSMITLIVVVIAGYTNTSLSNREIPLPGDSLQNPSFIKNIIKYQSYYSFINYDRNYIEWINNDAVYKFYSKIKKTPDRKLNILHIGDSHLQADIPSGFIRNRLQEILGYGGRGLVFPYKAAETHAAYDYKTYCTGNWLYNRNTQREIIYEMGVIGATIHTNDTAASFSFVFQNGSIKENFTKLKIYCKQDSLSYNLMLKIGNNENPIFINCNNPQNQTSYVTVNLPKSADTLSFFVNKTNSVQSFFECYGLSIESQSDNGVLYNSTGINGAGLSSLLKQKLFGKQLHDLTPDLVIIDLGANDFYGGIFPSSEIEKNLNVIIDIIQFASPDASIIISNSQDIYYRRKRDILECKDFMQLTKKVAFEKNCAFYNYYEITGGKTSMNKWYQTGLAKSDKIHLTTAGYNVRGELLLNAILNSYYKFLLDDKTDTLLVENHIIDTFELKSYFIQDVNFLQESKKQTYQVYHEPDLVTESGNKIYYTIKSGDNLGSIAIKFGVSVKQLQYWNGISGTKIIAGETLIIYKNNKINSSQPANKNLPKNTSQTNTPTQKNSYKRFTYIVKSGDSLWAIAKKYGTSVDSIKKLNNLKSDRLTVGQKLLIP